MWPDSILTRFQAIPSDNQTEGEYQWDCDLLTAEGECRFRAVCEAIREESANMDAHT